MSYAPRAQANGRPVASWAVNSGSALRASLNGPCSRPFLLLNAVPLFQREYATLCQLNHPLIIRAYEYGAEDERPFYAMELISGKSLRELAPMTGEKPRRFFATLRRRLRSSTRGASSIETSPRATSAERLMDVRRCSTSARCLRWVSRERSPGRLLSCRRRESGRAAARWPLGPVLPRRARLPAADRKARVPGASAVGAAHGMDRARRTSIRPSLAACRWRSNSCCSRF